jgi:hypothetical protein
MSFNDLTNDGITIEHRELSEDQFRNLLNIDKDDDLMNVASNEDVFVYNETSKELAEGVLFNIYPIELLPEDLVSLWNKVIKQSNPFVADEQCVKEIYEHLWTYWITTELCRLIFEEMCTCHCNSCETCLKRWDLENRVLRLTSDECLSYQYLLVKIKNQLTTSFPAWLPTLLRSMTNPYVNPIEKKYFLRELPVTLYAEFPKNKRIAELTLLRRIHYVIGECTRRQRK